MRVEPRQWPVGAVTAKGRNRPRLSNEQFSPSMTTGKTSVFQPFCSRHPSVVLRIFGGTLAGILGIKIRELQLLVAPLASAYGTPGICLRHPWHLITAPLASAYGTPGTCLRHPWHLLTAPRLGITGLDNYQFQQHVTRSFFIQKWNAPLFSASTVVCVCMFFVEQKLAKELKRPEVNIRKHYSMLTLYKGMKLGKYLTSDYEKFFSCLVFTEYLYIKSV